MGNARNVFAFCTTFLSDGRVEAHLHVDALNKIYNFLLFFDHVGTEPDINATSQNVQKYLFLVQCSMFAFMGKVFVVAVEKF